MIEKSRKIKALVASVIYFIKFLMRCWMQTNGLICYFFVNMKIPIYRDFWYYDKLYREWTLPS